MGRRRDKSLRRASLQPYIFVAVLGLLLRDNEGGLCLRMFAARRWQDASVACQCEAERSGDPWLGVRAARALYRLGKRDDALVAAMRWFDSAADATARQIAGAAHQLRDEHPLARSLFEQALDEHLRAGDHDESARDAQMLAGTLMYQGIFGAALDTAELGVREAELADDLRLEGNALLGLGKIWAEVGDAARARTVYWQARERTAEWPEDQAWVYLELGILDCDTGHRDKGMKLLELALDVATAHGLTMVVDAAHLNLARADRELGHIAAADAHMRGVTPEQRERSAGRFVDGLIAADRGDRTQADRLLALAAADPPTDDYASEIALQRGKIAERRNELDEAETFYRQAIGLVEQLRADSNLELRPWVLAHRREPYSALLTLLARANRPGDALVIAEQLHARTWRDALLRYAGTKDSGKRVSAVQVLGQRLRVTVPPMVSENDLRRILAHRDALLFSDTGIGVWRFHMVDGVIERLDRLPDDTAELVDQWRAAPNDRLLAERLGAAVIPPAAFRPSMRPLYIVADGVLATLSFAALRNAGHPLVEDRVLVRLPDVLALECRTVDEPSRPAVLLGDSRGDLPAARREVLELGGLLGAEAFVGDDVTIDRLQSGQHAAVLHLALHAEEDAGGPSLVLARGAVSSADIVAMKLAPRLAVLAGCATAVGRDAEGWDALSSAFLLTGTRTVVATLQSVGDADAAAFLRRFYALGGQQRPGVALAMAQRELTQSNDAAAWAPYVVYGGADAADCEPPP